ncbi:MAG: viral aspartic protease [Cereibacter changlensis]
MTPLPPSLRLRPAALTLPLLLALAACGGGGGSEPPREPTLESYTTDHNGFGRVRLNKAANRADDRILAQFDDGNPASPAGYKELIADQEKLLTAHNLKDRLFVEVIGEVETADGPERVSRILRITADTEPFQDIAQAEKQYYFRGENYAWVSLDGEEVLSGSHSQGLVDMMIDFDTKTMNIELRTEISDHSQVETSVIANGLPFDVATGAYGGPITLTVRDPKASEIYLQAGGTLLGNVGGNPAFADSKHGLTTSGLYTVTGTDEATGRTVDADGVFFGIDPNALPPR